MNRGILFVSSFACLVLAGYANSSTPATTQNSAAEPVEITATLPVIPAVNFNLNDFGGVGDSKTFNTDAFTHAVDAISKAGGGHLIVPAGVYKTMPFSLTSHMDLHLNAGATIKAPETFADYGIPDPNQPGPPPSPQERFGGSRVRPLISCPPNTTDISITGAGTIDGSGAMFWIWSDKAARRYPPGRRIVFRPNLVVLQGIQRLLVDGVTLTNSPMYHLVPRGRDITIQNIRVVAPSDAPNTDAMDPGGERIVIRHCEIDNGDDDVALQSGCHDVLIEDLTCLHGHGISIGSSTSNGLSHIIVRHCTFDGTDNGLRIKSNRGRGGEVHDIWYSDITMRNVKRPFDINMLYNGNANTPTDVGPRQPQPEQTGAIPNFHDIHITNLTVTHSPLAGRILGLPEQMASNITFANVTIEADRGFLVQDAKDITFDNVRIDAAIGDPLVIDNATVNWNGTIKTSGGGSPVPFY
jgi:polygalacturonase